jgi:Uncharacterized protein conserved in bacteria (DUF2252)
VTIAAYLGTSNRFDRAILSFARAYSDKTERDWETLIKSKDLRDAKKALDSDTPKVPKKKTNQLPQKTAKQLPQKK